VTTLADYLSVWVWESPRGGWYCRINGEWYPSREEAEAVVLRLDAEAGITHQLSSEE
jgi:hypothetical protein